MESFTLIGGEANGVGEAIIKSSIRSFISLSNTRYLGVHERFCFKDKSFFFLFPISHTGSSKEKSLKYYVSLLS